jgi:hypothetical protein
MIPNPQPPAEAKKPDQPEDHSIHCPVCSSRLEEMKCKLLCKKCGYFMSCADFY